ncbi:NADH:ubiquinone reductase (Na(+)-transporting) subunit C [Alistipes sp.]|uniref:NADH:ubiquinone reductase (Na(+)-transporting) subunit C n=1 Tax=Alistipes sp. TaxID=1872444 RepID=UPI003AF1D5C2
MATKKFRCNVCGYIHEGAAAPETCPVCSAPASEFTELKKKGFMSDTNSNAYIIVYSTVMVVLVAAILAVAAMALQKRQYANELNEKKQSILLSLSAGDKNYDEFIEAEVLDAQGQPTGEGDVFALLNDLPGAFAAGKFPIFQAADGRVVIPVTGSGLWGPIWGYVALEKDMNTVAGIIMAHKGETPGLGAEIATPKYQARFVGKKIFDGDKFVSVVLRKGGARNPEHEVDAISGGTKTSDGVTAMLYNSLGHYLPLIESRRGQAVTEPVGTLEPPVETATGMEAPAAAAGVHAAAPGAETSAAEQVSNDQNAGENE